MEQELRRVAQFNAPDAMDLPTWLSDADLRRALGDATDPPALAMALRDALAQRHPGVVSPLNSAGSCLASFGVRAGGGRVKVIVSWWPIQRFWTVGVLPARERGRARRRRERDTVLTRGVVDHLRDVLARRDDVTDVRWMTDDEAQATVP